MGTPKKKMTLEEHQQVGTLLQEVYDKTLDIIHAISGKKGIKAPIIDRALKVHHHTVRLKSVLDDVYYQDTDSNRQKSPYYPGG